MSTWAGGLVATVLVIASLLLIAKTSVPAAFLCPKDRLMPADAALVFSGDPSYQRTLEAARLYHWGFVRYIVLSGRGVGGDSADNMAAVAVQDGVPPDALVVERHATNTFENVVYVRWLLVEHRIHRLILITSPQHQRRAYLVARRFLPGIVLINHPIRAREWRPQGWWENSMLRRAVLNEYIKLAGYLVLGRI